MLRVNRLESTHLGRTTEGSGGDSLVLTLAARRSLSGYDASYLALAIELALPLATNDRRLAAAARLEGVAVRGPLESAP